MNDINLPSHARVVVVGGGVIGTSVAYHLGLLGWKDIVLLEQPFVKEEKKRIRDLIADAAKASSSTLAIKNVSRLKVGES